MNRTAPMAALAVLLMALIPTALAQDANQTASGPGGPCPTDVNCTGGTRPSSDTCMDGQQGNETCDPNVRYLGGPSQAPQGDAAQPAKTVPALGVFAVFAAFALAVAAMARVQRRR